MPNRKDIDYRLSNPRKKKAGKKTSPKKVDGLVNASLLAFEFPDTFERPSDYNLKKIKPGDYVKVARNNERFWIRVDGFVGRKIHGTVDNKLVKQKDLKLGDSIFLMKKNIYDVYIV